MAYNGIQINGSCEIAQETVAAVGNGKYIVDGWAHYYAGTMTTLAQYAAAGPVANTNSVTVMVSAAQSVMGTSDYVMLRQKIEGYRTIRLAWGTANAQPLSFGFWVMANRAGSYSGAIRNAANNRSYPFPFTVNTAATWEFKTVTIPGDTTGTWMTDNTTGLEICFAVAAGTGMAGPANAWGATNMIAVSGTINGIATTSDQFWITGLVMLPGIELPSAGRAPLIMRPVDQELQACKRYYERNESASSCSIWVGYSTSGSGVYMRQRYQAKKRATPSMTLSFDSAVAFPASAPIFDSADTEGFQVHNTSSATGVGYFSFGWAADARL